MFLLTIPGVTLPTDAGALALLVVALVVGLVGFGYGVVQSRMAYRMYSTRKSTVSDVANRPGTVEVEGIVRVADDSLRAPFTDTECVAYEYEIEAFRPDDDGSDWETVDSGDERVPFRIEDDTGSVLVEPDGAALELDAQRVFRGRAGEESFSGVAEALAGLPQLEIGGFSINTSGDRRYTERRLDPGERVYVLGPARHDPTASESAGEVNAVIGPTSEDELLERLTNRMLGRAPFLLADGTERTALSRVAKRALSGLTLGAITLAFVGLVVGG